ncbi:MAG: orotidine-5'-phosphate decarboxylase [Acidobacteriota bacterium]|nr:orotidine-5'-phosphate decarboxylase [Acidobacteriota bacterium]
MNRNPIIIALDVDDAEQARVLIKGLGDSVSFYKVGMELYAGEGMAFVHELIGSGKQVFLDLKLYDISETVKRATARIAQTGVRFLTIHGSSAVLRAAVEGRGNSKLQLLGVTVLTSFDQQDLAELGYACNVLDLVVHRAGNAVRAGVDGIVCSPRDATAVREAVGPRSILVTPGVRSLSAATGDQKRVATPAEAIQKGADYLVIGRQVTRAADPLAEVERIMEEISQVAITS